MSKSYERHMNIVSALNELLKKQSIDEVKVIDICSLAEIGRTTFYRYFYDVYSIATWLFNDISERSINKIGIDLSWHEGHLQIFTLLLEWKTFFIKAFEKDDYVSVIQFGSRMGYNMLVDRTKSKLGRILTKDELVIYDYYSMVSSNICAKWAQDGMVIPPEAAADILDLFIPDLILQLGECSNVK